MEAIRLRLRATHVIVAVIPIIAIVALVATSARGRPHVPAVEGRVTDETGAPIVLATVCAVAPLPTCTVTGPTGDYRIDDVGRDVVIDAFAPRYVLAHRTRSPRSTAEHAVVDVEMRRGGRLVVGVVRDAAGRPIRDAYVIAGDALALADADGHYEIWLNRVSVAAAARGYARHTARTDLPDRIDFALVPEATLAGMVVDAATGKPAAGVHVTLASSRVAWDLLPDATTDATGRFRISNLEPGVYVASIDARHAIGSSEGAIAVGSGEHVDGVAIRAMPAHEITGRVLVEPTGAACADPTVVVSDVHRHEQHVGSLDDARLIHVGGLMPGAYEVDVECTDHLANAEYDRITITDHDVTDQRWPVNEGATIKGRVSSARGTPLAGVEIGGCNEVQRGHEWTCSGTRIVSDTGEFELHGLQPGKVKITANAIQLDGAPASRDVRASVDVSLAAPAHVDLVLEPSAGAIAGRVLHADGTAASNVLVAASDDGTVSGAHTDAFGRFTIDALAGDYQLACDTMESLALGNIGVRCDGGAHVRVTADHTTTVELVTPPQLAVIRGHVIDDRGRPVTDATVAIRGPEETDDKIADEVRVGSDGSFVARERIGGTYAITARRPGGGESVLEHVATGTDVTLTIAAPGSIAVVVDGAPTVERFDVELADLALGTGIRDDIITITSGRFTLPALPVGRYRLFVTTADASSFTDVDVVSGKTSSIELKLGRFVTVVGRVVEHGTGRPLAGIEMCTTPLDRSPFFAYFDHSASTDASGKFAMHDVERARLKIDGLVGTDSAKYPWITLSWTVGADASDIVDVGDLEVVPAFDGPARPGMTIANAPDGSVRVTRVAPGGPAAKAGIVVGDELTAIDGVDVVLARASSVEAMLRGPSGLDDTVTLRRGPTVTIVLAER
jgi:protocatechuate 3,4-dioxygenase beta subunit